MEDARDKLRNLKRIMPGLDQTVYDFGEYLSETLGDELEPLGFRILSELTIYNLKNGIEQADAPSTKKLAGYPSCIYDSLKLYIPAIADAAFPESFAKGVRNSYNQEVKGEF